MPVNRPPPFLLLPTFRIWLFYGWFAESLASACSDVKHTWVIQLGGMVARVYDQSGRMATSDAGYRQQCMPAPCSVVQADFREKIDSPDRDFCVDTQVGAEQDITCAEVTFGNPTRALCCDVG